MTKGRRHRRLMGLWLLIKPQRKTGRVTLLPFRTRAAAKWDTSLNSVIRKNKPTRHMLQYTLTLMKRALVTALCFGAAFCVSAQTLEHRYSFNDPAGSTNFVDSVGGTNWNGTLVPNGGSPALTGSSLELDGL